MIRKFRLLTSILAIGTVFAVSIVVTTSSHQAYAAGTTYGCNSKKVLGVIPTWYAYLQSSGSGADCVPVINEPKDFILIGLAVLDALMRVAAILAVVFIVIGGIKYTASQGSPESTKNAKDTIVNAIIGLVITILASAIIAFVARMVG